MPTENTWGTNTHIFVSMGKKKRNQTKPKYMSKPFGSWFYQSKWFGLVLTEPNWKIKVFLTRLIKYLIILKFNIFNHLI